MNVSVIVVCYNERDNIDQCLGSLVRQDYPKNQYEIILVDNGSDDGTQKIIQEYARQDSRIKLLINPTRGIAGSRNLGAMAAAHELVAFIDADCIAPANWLRALVAGFTYHHAKDSLMIAVGGSNVPPQKSSRYHEVLEIFLNTYLGSHGSVQGARFQSDRSVAHLPTVNVLYQKVALFKVGGFDVTFGNIGEDQDLSFRLRAADYRFFYLAKAEVTHKLRPDFKSWIKNMFTYGKGRMWLIRKHPWKNNPVLLLPMVLAASLPLAMFSVLSSYFLLPFSYFFLMLVASFFACRRANKLRYVLDLFGLYAGTHLSYGLGQWYGLFKNRELERFQSSKHLIIECNTESLS
jgi:glycosyltransferase involved in cell wall biosynthesis